MSTRRPSPTWLTGAILLCVSVPLPERVQCGPAADTTIVLRPDQQIYWYGERLTSPLHLQVDGALVIANGLPDVDPDKGRRDSLTLVLYSKYPFARALIARGLDAKAVSESTDRVISRSMDAILTEAHRAAQNSPPMAARLAAVADSSVIDTHQPIEVQGNKVTLTALGDTHPMSIVLSAFHAAGRRPGTSPETDALDLYRHLLFQLRIPSPRMIFLTPGGIEEFGEPLYSEAILDLEDLRFHTGRPMRVINPTAAEEILSREHH